MSDLSALICTCLLGLAAISILRWRMNPLRSLPTVGGPSVPLISYLGAVNFLRDARKVLVEGYRKYPGVPFKVALPGSWMVILSAPKMMDELWRRPDDEFSLNEIIDEFFQISHSVGKDIHQDQYHVEVVRDKLTRSIPVIFQDIVEELSMAVHEHIPTTDDSWVLVKVLDATQRIVARTSNRVFVGAPLCRNDDYLDLAIGAMKNITEDGNMLMLFPNFLKPIIASVFGGVRKNVRRVALHLKPILDSYRAKMANPEGDHPDPDKSPILIQWLLQQSILRRRSSDEEIATRLLMVNVAALDTTSKSLTHALFDLAAAPEYIQPLREEIESVLAVEGWTKIAMGKMWKLDSFLKESQRVNGLTLVALGRKALRDVTLSDGTVIPAGSIVAAPAVAIHHDDSKYPTASTFDPFRFSRMREAEDEGNKHQFVKTSMEFIPFGHGRHSCPGRFFAANELKALLAYIVLNYDLKLVGPRRPENVTFAVNVMPDPNGELLFRKRRVV
ncbi:cytochrome P450 [Earliella scabrosa]|nr:cytochrome P450 [Earliella scabrosa]